MRTLIATVLLVVLSSPAFAQPTDFSIPAHVSRVDGRAVIEREDLSEDIESNLTLVEGDRIRTLSGRVEILFADGTLLHLDRNTVVDFLREDFVRVMEGRVRWTVAREARASLRADTPAATLELDPGGEYRVAVAPNGDAELAVLRGSGALLNDHGDTALRSGERAVAAMGRAPSQAFYANAASWDDFDRWSDSRRRANASAVSARYLPDELDAYGAVFDTHGSWRTDPAHGYVWYPLAGSSWQPYSHGRWHSYPRYGWTWIGRDPWAWPTHHFGRWGFSAGAWFWIPGRRWAPAWVAWASSPGYVGWSPLGWNDHPIYRVNVYSSNYSAGYPWCGWTFIRERHFGGRSWGSSDIFIGTSVAIVARGGNIVPAGAAPGAGRALPRSGARPGTAVPRGTAIPRSGGNGLAGSGGAEGGLAGVPTARPRRIPTETIRSGGDRPRAVPREGAVVERGINPRGSEPRPAQPRARTPQEPGEARGGTSAARPRGGSSGEGASSRPAPADRPVRRAQPRGQQEGAASPYAAPAAPQYRRAPEPRERSSEPPSAAPAERPSMGSRRPEPRERAPEPRERSIEPRERATEPRQRAIEPRERGAAPRERSVAPAERRSPPPERPSARPAPPTSNGGGAAAAAPGDRRAPSAASRPGGQAQSRPRGGG